MIVLIVPALACGSPDSSIEIAGCEATNEFTCPGSPSTYIECTDAAGFPKNGSLAACEAVGGHPPWLADQSEANCVKARLEPPFATSPAGSFMWVGLQQSPNATAVDQGWAWPDGSSFLVWRETYPRDFSTACGFPFEDHQADCALLVNRSGVADVIAELVDAPCPAAFVVCEL